MSTTNMSFTGEGFTWSGFTPGNLAAMTARGSVGFRSDVLAAGAAGSAAAGRAVWAAGKGSALGSPLSGAAPADATAKVASSSNADNFVIELSGMSGATSSDPF